VVQGPWDDPIMLPDAQSLIRRSGAAAPLLGSGGKPLNAGDAVRSVIDQLMATPQTASPAAAPAATPAAAPSAPNSRQ
jgi:AsmA protein